MTDYKKALEGRTIKEVRRYDHFLRINFVDGDDLYITLFPATRMELITERGAYELIEREQ